MDIEITREMIDAGVEAQMEYDGKYASTAILISEIYRAMELQRLDSCEDQAIDSSA